MNKEKIKSSDEEVKIIKSKYKKMRLTIFLILLTMFLIYLGNLLITALQLQSILQNNVAVDLGNNYKLTTTYNRKINTTYYKDGICSRVFSDNTYGLYYKDNEFYNVMYETKEYQKINSEYYPPLPYNVTLLNYLSVNKEFVASLKDIMLFVCQDNIKFHTEIINNQKYIVTEIKTSGTTWWVNADTYLVEKEDHQGQIVEQKVEENVVTDENVKAPWDLGFVEKNAN